MASTINGYEGTGRSLSLKLLNDFRNSSIVSSATTKKIDSMNDNCHSLLEIELNEAIRYANGDDVEVWLNHLLCLEATTVTYFNQMPPKWEDCELYYVNKNTLFSYHKLAETFLQQLVSLFVSSHYKNSPNDLLMIADAPAHQLYCLVPRLHSRNSSSLPDILCVIQVSFEGEISEKFIQSDQLEGKRASGDLIPWIISQQFQDIQFPSLRGARVVRIATHPCYQRMGYGLHALQLLSDHFENCFQPKQQISTNKQLDPLCNIVKPLLTPLSETQQNSLDYLGVSFGLTSDLFRFWKKAKFVPLYLRQTTSEVTGEHSCIMIKPLKCCEKIEDFFSDFKERFLALLVSPFQSMPASLALNILHGGGFSHETDVRKQFLCQSISARSLLRLQAYCLQQVDYHLILDLLPGLARFYFLGYFMEFFLSSVQESVLLCMGLQFKSVEETASELEMETTQVLGFFRKTVKKILERLNRLSSIKKNYEVQPGSKCHTKKRKHNAQ